MPHYTPEEIAEIRARHGLPDDKPKKKKKSAFDLTEGPVVRPRAPEVTGPGLGKGNAIKLLGEPSKPDPLLDATRYLQRHGGDPGSTTSSDAQEGVRIPAEVATSAISAAMKAGHAVKSVSDKIGGGTLGAAIEATSPLKQFQKKIGQPATEYLAKQATDDELYRGAGGEPLVDKIPGGKLIGRSLARRLPTSVISDTDPRIADEQIRGIPEGKKVLGMPVQDILTDALAMPFMPHQELKEGAGIGAKMLREGAQFAGYTQALPYTHEAGREAQSRGAQAAGDFVAGVGFGAAGHVIGKAFKPLVDKAGSAIKDAAATVGQVAKEKDLPALRRALDLAVSRGNTAQADGIAARIDEVVKGGTGVTPGAARASQAILKAKPLAKAGAAGAGMYAAQKASDGDDGGPAAALAMFATNPRKGEEALRKMAPEMLHELMTHSEGMLKKLLPNQDAEREQVLSSMAAIQRVLAEKNASGAIAEKSGVEIHKNNVVQGVERLENTIKAVTDQFVPQKFDGDAAVGYQTDNLLRKVALGKLPPEALLEHLDQESFTPEQKNALLDVMGVGNEVARHRENLGKMLGQSEDRNAQKTLRSIPGLPEGTTISRDGALFVVHDANGKRIAANASYGGAARDAIQHLRDNGLLTVAAATAAASQLDDEDNNAGALAGLPLVGRKGEADFFLRSVEHVAESKTLKTTGKKWLEEIVRNSHPEERKFLGIEEWLKERLDKSLTKDEVLGQLTSKMQNLQVEETVLGGSQKPTQAQLQEKYGRAEMAIMDFANRMKDKHGEDWYPKLSPEERQERERLVAIRGEHEDRYLNPQEYAQKPTRYADKNYQTPGGENYQERILQLNPHDTSVDTEVAAAAKRKGWTIQSYDEGNGVEWNVHTGDEEPGFQWVFKDGKGARGEVEAELRKIFGMGPRAPEDGAAFEDSHFPDHPNLLGWDRLKTQEINGKKYAKVEEIQPQWSQKGRDEGYQEPLSDRHRAVLAELGKEHDKVRDKYDDASEEAQAARQAYEDHISDAFTKFEKAERAGMSDAEVEAFRAGVTAKRKQLRMEMNEAEEKALFARQAMQDVQKDMGAIRNGADPDETKAAREAYLAASKAKARNVGKVIRLEDAYSAAQRTAREEIAKEKGLDPDKVTAMEVESHPKVAKLGDELDAAYEEEKNTKAAFVEASNAMALLHRTRQGAVPDQPFKQTSDAMMLHMKRVIKQASDEGLDGVIWTPGEVQNKRYSLSNAADEITYDPFHLRIRTTRAGGDLFDPADFHGMFVARKNGHVVHTATIKDPAKDLTPIIGKDAAKRLLESERVDGLPHTLKGAQLEIGGKGMRTAYDETLPNALKKYAKSLGVDLKINRDISLPHEQGKEATNLRVFDMETGEMVDEDYVHETYQDMVDHWGRVLKTEQGADGRTIYHLGDGKVAIPEEPPKQSGWHGFEITPELKAAIAKGQPLLSVAALAAAAQSQEEDPKDPFVQHAGGLGPIGAVVALGKGFNFGGRLKNPEILGNLLGKTPDAVYEALKKLGDKKLTSYLENVEKYLAEVGTSKVRRHLSSMVEASLGEAKGWYQRSAEGIERAFPDPAERKIFVDLLVTYSAQQRVGVDLKDALLVKAANDLGLDVSRLKVGGKGGNKAKKVIEQVLTGRGVDGKTTRKILEFAEALNVDTRSDTRHNVVFDTLMSQATAAKFPKESETWKRFFSFNKEHERWEGAAPSEGAFYDALERLITDIANKKHIRPEDAQAAIWLTQKRAGRATSLRGVDQHADYGSLLRDPDTFGEVAKLRAGGPEAIPNRFHWTGKDGQPLGPVAKGAPVVGALGAAALAGSDQDQRNPRTSTLDEGSFTALGAALAGAALRGKGAEALKTSRPVKRILERAAALAKEIPDAVQWRKALTEELGEKGNPFVREVAEAYLKHVGMRPAKADPVGQVDETIHRQIAELYDAMESQHDDPRVKAAYKRFSHEIDDQFATLVGSGIKVVPTMEDPYRNSAEMMRDVMVNKTLKVFAGSNDHPLLTPEQNVKFRAVHDFFGHAMEGNQFGAVGEENAYREHSRMFSRPARGPMAAETRGQNSWVNFGPHADLPVAEKPFATQKAFVMPPEYMKPYAVAGAAAAGASVLSDDDNKKLAPALTAGVMLASPQRPLEKVLAELSGVFGKELDHTVADLPGKHYEAVIRALDEVFGNEPGTLRFDAPVLDEVVTKLSDEAFASLLQKLGGKAPADTYPLKFKDHPLSTEFKREKPDGVAPGLVMQGQTGQEYLVKGGTYAGTPQSEHGADRVIQTLFPDLPSFESRLLKPEEGYALLDRVRNKPLNYDAQTSFNKLKRQVGDGGSLYMRPMADLKGEVRSLRDDSPYAMNDGFSDNAIRGLSDRQVEQSIQMAVAESITNNADLHAQNIAILPNSDLIVLDRGFSMEEAGPMAPRNYNALQMGFTNRVLESVFKGTVHADIKSILRPAVERVKAMTPAELADLKHLITEGVLSWGDVEAVNPARQQQTIKYLTQRIEKLPEIADELYKGWLKTRQEVGRTSDDINKRILASDGLTRTKLEISRIAPILGAIGLNAAFTDKDDPTGALDPGNNISIAMASMAGMAMPEGKNPKELGRLAREFVKKATGRSVQLDELIDRMLGKAAQGAEVSMGGFLERGSAGHLSADAREAGYPQLGDMMDGIMDQPAPLIGRIKSSGRNKGYLPDSSSGSTLGDMGVENPFEALANEPEFKMPWDLLDNPAYPIIARASRHMPDGGEVWAAYSDALYTLDKLHEKGVMPQDVRDKAMGEWRTWFNKKWLAKSYFGSVANAESGTGIAKTLDAAAEAWVSGRMDRRDLRQIINLADAKMRDLGELPNGGFTDRIPNWKDITGEGAQKNLERTVVRDPKTDEPLLVFRGEHGEGGENGQVQSRLGSISFGDSDTASMYAESPNVHGDEAKAPRVMPAYLSIKKPFLNDPTEPFVTFADVQEKLGKEEAKRLALLLDEEISQSPSFEENFDVDSVAELLQKKPKALKDLDVEAFHFFDNPEVVEALKAKGYDGAIHEGYGDNVGQAEYKVFDQSQVYPAYGHARPGYASVDILKRITKLGAAAGLGGYAATHDKDDPFQGLAALGAGMLTVNAFGGFRTLKAGGEASLKLLDASLRAAAGRERGNRAMRYLFNGYGLPEAFNGMRTKARRDLAVLQTETAQAIAKTEQLNLQPDQKLAMAEMLRGLQSMKGVSNMLKDTPVYQRFGELGKRMGKAGVYSKGRTKRVAQSVETLHHKVIMGELIAGVHANPAWWTDGPAKEDLREAAKNSLRNAFKAKVYGMPVYSAADVARAVEDHALTAEQRAARALRERGFTTLPTHLNRGPLKGKWVRQDIVEELDRIQKMPERIRHMGKNLQRLHTIWKRFHTVDNPATHVTNVGSNMLTGHISGVLPMEDPATWKSMKGSFSELLDWAKNGNISPDVQAALDHGMLQGDTQALQEYARIANILGDMSPDGPSALFKMAGRLGKGLQKVGKYSQNTYQFEEQLFKLATFKRLLGKGHTAEEAAKEAEKWFFDYGDTSPLIDDLRTHWWGLPFITWSYKMAPRMLEMAAENPLRVMGVLGMMGGLANTGGFNEVDEKDLPSWMTFTPADEMYNTGVRALKRLGVGAPPRQKELPEYMQPRFPGDVQNINTAGDGEDPNLLNVGKYLPVPFLQGGGLNNLIGGITGQMGGPAARGLYEGITNRHIDRDQVRGEIRDPDAPLPNRIGQFIGHELKDFAPPLLPGGRQFQKLTGTEPWRDAETDPAKPMDQLMGGLAGVTRSAMPPERRAQNLSTNMSNEIAKATYSIDKQIEKALKREDYDRVDILSDKRASIIEAIQAKYEQNQ